MGGQVPVQLRLAFTAPTRPVQVEFILMGLYVLVEPGPHQSDEVFAYLVAAGAEPAVSEQGDLRFAVARLGAIRELPPQVRTRFDDSLQALAALALHPSAEGLPATLSCTPAGQLVLSWFDGEEQHDEAFYPEAAAALLQADLPFEATPEAWQILEEISHLPMIDGRVRANLDGYLEISTTKPQRVEAAPLPGLFRLDETHFGLALAFADAVTETPGFLWEGRPPTPEPPPPLPSLPLHLDHDDEAQLEELLTSLSAYRSRVLVWEHGLGRRLFALAAIEALDAWPACVVTLPSGVWTWQRHLDLFGRSHALSHDRADAHILTYHDLVHRRVLPAPQAIIFDDLSDPEAAEPQVRAALRRFDTIPDVYRLSTVHSWPGQPAEAVRLMSVLRPGEFLPGSSVVQRYPLTPDRRALEHVEAYLSRRTRSAAPSPSGQRSSVLMVQPSEAVLRALEDLPVRLSGVDPAQVLAEALEIISAGPPQALSPKVPIVSAAVRSAAEAGRRVAVCTRHRRTATLLRATLRPLRVSSVDAAEGPGSWEADAQVVVVRFERVLPDLRSFDEVVVVDYPWSSEVIERAVGAAGGDHSCPQVSTVHMPQTVDDRLAMLAARRRELGSVVDPASPISAEDVRYLLTPRH